MTASIVLAVISWLALAARGAFDLTWLAPYESLLEGAFAIGLISSALAWSADRWGSVAALRIVAVIVSIAVPLFAAEFLARFIFRDVQTSADGRTFFARREGPPISINHLGFREREVGPRSPGRYRIAVVGDSFTWGQGVQADERFSAVLERSLGSRYEVLNFGIPGNNMPEHLQVLERALSVSPDFVLLQLYINDFEMPDMARPGPRRLLPFPGLDRWLLASSVLYDLVNDMWVQAQERTGLVESYVRYMDRNLKDPNLPNARRAFGLLRRFIERARMAGVSPGIVLFPNPGVFGASYPFGYLHDGVRRVCADEHITCLDLREPFSTFKHPQEMWVSRFDQHPNARANKRAAQEILSVFSPAWQAGR